MSRPGNDASPGNKKGQERKRHGLPTTLYQDSDWHREYGSGSETGYRSGFRRDYARVLHSPAFRRLQGKTQLFPGIESDFFRNRLTHSLEVAQIAKSIALRLNSECDFLRRCPIDLDLIETAALAHDLGHPPFGHNGEEALDACMRRMGGFEGNAQTLRILARLEKKEPDVPIRSKADDGVGLDLTYRTLASVLKYDSCIPPRRGRRHGTLVKGYYRSERKLVEKIKEAVLGKGCAPKGQFKTIECGIMDLADDIAYSTYDLEDAFKAGFVTPIKLIAAASDETIVASLKAKTGLDQDQILEQMMSLFGSRIVDLEYLEVDPANVRADNPRGLALLAVEMDRASENLTRSGALRTNFTSELVNEYVDNVGVEIDARSPALSTVSLRPDLEDRVAILKHLTYEMVIQSPSLKTVKYRGKDIVTSIFDALCAEEGELLLPEDFRDRAGDAHSDGVRSRVICDFIAGMTDRYAVEFYGRLKSDTPQTLFKPL